MTPDTRSDVTEQSSARYDLDDPLLYVNRELAWLSYNRRILHEAENDAAPLLERVAFLAEFGANLDQFFAHRMGGLKQQLGAGLTRLSIDGCTVEQQLADCRDHVEVYLADEAFVYYELCHLLAEQDIRIFDYRGLDPDQAEYLRRHYVERIHPLLSPMALDANRPFPTVSNLTNNLIVHARQSDSGHDTLIRIELPVTPHLPRFVRLPGRNDFLPLEQLVKAHLNDLLPGATVLTSGLFRVTRNAIAHGDDSQALDLVDALPDDVRAHHWARHTRLEVTAELPLHLVKLIASGLGLGSMQDIYTVNSLMAARDLRQLARLPVTHLHYARHHPVGHPRLAGAASMLDDVARSGPVFLQHPYQAYEQTVLPLLREAAADATVLAIKATVSRATRGSGLLAPLIMAAKRGKHVVVVARSSPRVDPAADEKWARYLESTGMAVSFGPADHPSHAGAMLIVRYREDGTLSRTVHVASGHHDSTTAKPDADVGLISAEPDLGAETTELFNLLTSGLVAGRSFDALLVAPATMKTGLIQRIDRERRAHEHSGAGRIVIKANSLEDVDITRALYKAARAGVAVDLIIRAECRLRPGIAGLTDNVRVVSVLGRFREHGRAYYFHNGGEAEYFIGSADPVAQSLARRVDVLVPVRGALKAELAAMLNVQLEHGRGAWQMDANGDYRRESSGSDSDAQTQLLLRAQRIMGSKNGVEPTAAP